MSETPRSATSGHATPFVKMLLVVTAVSAIALVSVLGCHKRFGHHGDPERLREFAEWRVEKVLKKIDASEDQKANVEFLEWHTDNSHGDQKYRCRSLILK